MQDNDTSRRRKFYDQMSEAYDLGSFEEFDSKMNNPESRRKLHEFIDKDGKYDIGDFEYFDNAMKPVEQTPPKTAEQPVQAPAVEPQQQTSAQLPASAEMKPAAVSNTPQAAAPATEEKPKEPEYPQPYDALGNVITNNGEPYSQEVLKRYYSKDNRGSNYKDLAQISEEVAREQSVSGMRTTGGAGYVPSQQFPIAEPSTQTNEQEQLDAEMRRLHANSTQSDEYQKLYGMFDDAFKNGKAGGKSAYAQAFDLANEMGIDNEQKYRMLSRINRQYASDRAAEAVQSIVDQMPERSADPMEALRELYYNRELQQKLWQTAETMGNDYDQYVNMFIKPQLIEAMKQKYGGTDNDWIGVKGLFSNWQHMSDRLESQDVSGLLGEHFAEDIDKSIGDAFAKALEKEGELQQFAMNTDNAGAQLGALMYAKRESNLLKDPDKIMDAFEQQLFGQSGGEGSNGGGNDDKMLDVAVKEILTDPSLSEEIFRRAEGKNMSVIDYAKKYVIPQMVQAIRNRFEQSFIQREMPKSTIEHIMKGITEDNVIAMIANTYMRTDSQQRIANEAEAMTAQGLNPDVETNIWTEGARLATGMAADFWLWGGWGKLGAKATGELLAKRVAERAAAEHITKEAAMRLVEEEGKQFLGRGVVESMMRHIPQSAVTMAGAEGTSELVRSIRDREDALTIIGNTLGAVGSGAFTGTLFGVTGGAAGRLTSKLSGAKRLAGKLAAYGVEAGTMYTAEELQKIANGEEAFENPYDGLIESAIKLGFIKFSANPLATGVKLLDAIAHPVKAIKGAMTPDKPLLTDDDVRIIRDSAEGAELMDALTRMRPARSTDKGEREGYISEADAEIAATAYRDFMTNADIPWVLKNKVAHLLGGVIAPAGFEVNAEIVDTDGGSVLRTRDIDGNLISETRYDSHEAAQEAADDMSSDLFNNATSALEEQVTKNDIYLRVRESIENEYQVIAEKYGDSADGELGSRLSEREKNIIYMHQHLDELMDVYQKIADGADLGVDGEKLATTFLQFFDRFMKDGNTIEAFRREFEGDNDILLGDIDVYIEGHSKEEAERLAKENGEGIVKVSDGVYRTESENNMLVVYQEAMRRHLKVSEYDNRGNETGNVPLLEDTAGDDGGTPPPPAGTSGGSDGTETGGSGTENGENRTETGGSGTTPQRTERRDAAYNRGAAVTQDPSSLSGIGYDNRLAQARLMQLMPENDPTLNRLRNEIVQTVESGNDGDVDRIINEARQYGQLNDAQVEAIEQYRDAAETQKGIYDAIAEQSQKYEEVARMELEDIASADGSVRELQLRDGSTVYYKSGDLDNLYGGVYVSDLTGETRQVPVREIVNIGEPQSLDDIVADSVNQYAAGLQTQYEAIASGYMMDPGQRVDMIVSGQPISAIVAGSDQAGNVIFQLEDGSQMPMSQADTQQAIAAADNVKIQQQLQAETESARLAEQQQRYGKGIKGYSEGQPDLSSPDTDARTAADYLIQQTGGDDKARKEQVASIQTNIDQLRQRQDLARQLILAQTRWLEGNEDIADASETDHVRQQISDATKTLADTEARMRNWGDIRQILMTPEEKAKFEGDRRKKVFNARTGYVPSEQQRLTQNEDHIAINEDGSLNFGQTPVSNVNNYLLKNYADALEAEQFMNQQRLALRNVQRDVIQPETNRLNDLLNDYVAGRTELSDAEVKDTVMQVAALEQRQDELSTQAVNLRTITEGIPALYERNGRVEELTPTEQRAKALDKASSREDKLRIARNIYKVYPEALDVIENQEPQTIEEYISQSLPQGKLNWEGFDRGERHIAGVQESVFGKQGATRGIGKGYSTNAFNPYLASEGSGMGFDEMVHYLYEDAPEVDGRKMYDDTEIRDALISMLLTAQKPSDISHLLIDNRIAEAEGIVKRQEELDREAEEEAKYQELQQWAEAHHLNPDEVETYNDYLAEQPWEFDDEVINQIIADYEQNQRSKEMDSQHPDGSVGSESEGSQEQVPVSGPTEGADTNTPVTGKQGAEGGTGSPAVPDNNVPGGAQGELAVQGLDGYSEKDITDLVEQHFNNLIDKDGAEIVGIKVIGSRANGTAGEDSDLDVLLEFKGQAREDDLFNILNDEENRLYIEGIPVDINPITEGKSGTIEQFLKRNAGYQKNNSFPARLAEAKAETDVNPTEAQKKAGNYKMGHISFGGYRMSIENPKGSTRSGVDASGKPWSIEMKDSYGYIGKKYGTDGDHLDFFINDDADLDTFDGRVYVVDQKNDDGSFDEHKVMYGYINWSAARKAYERNYEDGWWDKHVMQMIGVKKADFDKWLSDSDHKMKPFADYWRTKNSETVSDPVDQLLADVADREEAAKQEEVKPTWDEKKLSKIDNQGLVQLRKKAKADLSTSRVLLGTIDMNGDKATTLKKNIAQAEADLKVLDAEIEKRNAIQKKLIDDMEAGGAMVDHLQDIGINVTDNISEMRKARKRAGNDHSQEGKLRKMTTSDGSTYGFAYRGGIYLDPRKINANLPLHEYGHLWCEAFRRLNPEGWKDIIGIMKQDADTWNFVKQLNPNLTSEDDIAEEVIAKGSGDNGEERIRQEFERMNQRDPSYKSKWGNIWKNISKALQDFWKKVGDFLNIRYESPQQVYDQVLKDFANGVNPRKRVEQYLKQRDADYIKAAETGDVKRAAEIFGEALKENVGNGMTPFVAVDNYRKLQQTARKIKKGDQAAIDKAAEMMAPLIPENAVLVPVPSHEGKATDMLQLANAIASRTGSEVADILTGAPRKSQYENKKEGGKALLSSELGITKNGNLSEGKIPVVIDNVVDSGNTAEACIKALGTGMVVSLADSANKNSHAATLKSAEPIVFDRDGKIIPLSRRFDLAGGRYLGRRADAFDNLLNEIDRRQEAADDIVGKEELQAAIERHERERLTPIRENIQKRATKAVVQMVTNTGVPIRQVSQKEANQMMQMFTMMNIREIAGLALQERPSERKRYAVINANDPYAVPFYFEKKNYAEEYRVWGNRQEGAFITLDLDAYNDEVQGVMNAANIQPQIGVWHGSGAVFTKFDHSHMGEGAGSQVFGWGTYLSDSRRIGEDYANMAGEGWRYKGRTRQEVLASRGEMPEGRYNRNEDLVADIMRGLDNGRTYEEIRDRQLKFIESDISDYEEHLDELSEAELEDLQGFREEKAFVMSLKEEDFKKDPAHLYRVEIPDEKDAKYIDYHGKMGDQKNILDMVDNTLTADGWQRQEIDSRTKFTKGGKQIILTPNQSGADLYAELEDALGSDEAASKYLHDIGITGIKYPAGTIMGGGDGATNYVIFNEDDARIVDHVQFMFDDGAQPEQPVFYSNALRAVEGIKQDKATPEQWLKMLEKAGGLKAGEEKWLQLGDWLRTADVKSLTKQQLIDFIKMFQIQVKETKYREHLDVDNNPNMLKFRKEFDEIVSEIEYDSDELKTEMEDFENEMYEKYGYGWHNELDDDELERDEALNERYKDLADINDLAMSRMIERYGDEFDEAFEYNPGSDTLEPRMDTYGDDISDAAKRLLDFDEQPINSTRLNYTTEGLDNKKEIALTVPNIDPYNESDNIHFGDAGEGRAVAWIRFGDAYYTKDNAPQEIDKQWDTFMNKMAKKYDKDRKDTLGLLNSMTYEEREIMNRLDREITNKERSNMGRVLVIDEIQSKRHQDAREAGGYRDDSRIGELRNKTLELRAKVNETNKEYERIYGDLMESDEVRTLLKPVDGVVPRENSERLQEILTNNKDLIEAKERYNKANEELDKAALELEAAAEGPAPAPFEKNWHELAMKRMLRYAAENGYDKIAWTTGAQQTQRYDLGGVVDKIEMYPHSDPMTGEPIKDQYNVFVKASNGEYIHEPGMEGVLTREQILQNFGKDLGQRIMDAADAHPDGTAEISGEGLQIGGEGMRGFYDEILPRFMNKYGKRWGVKVGEIDLPDLEKSAQKMWSVDVTPEMKESVMQGQPMFQKGRSGRVYGWTDGQGIFLTPDGLNPNTPMHEYTHIWDKYIQKHDPQLWKEMVATFKKTAMWQQLRENPDYRAIWNDDDHMASEVHSRLTGARSEEEFEKAAANFDNKDADSIIKEVRNVLRRFWERLAELFGFGRDRLEEFILMPLRDALNGFNPITGDSDGRPEAMVRDMVEKTLMGVHNISEDKLRKAIKQGGLANPSMAVIDTRQHMHTDYGEISLIPKASLIDSKTGRNAGTFTADAWTPSYPPVSLVMKDAGWDKVFKDLRNIRENVDGGKEIYSKLRVYLDSYLDNRDPDAMYWWYMHDRGLNPKTFRNESVYDKNIQERVMDMTGGDINKEIGDLSEKDIREMVGLYHDYKKQKGEEVSSAEERIRKIKERLKDPNLKPMVKLSREKWLKELEKYGEVASSVNQFMQSVIADKQHEGEVDLYTTFMNARKAVQNEDRKADYEKWLNEFNTRYGVEEKIFTGYTPNGTPKYVANTLENVSKLMKKEGLNGAVNWSSIGNWIAKVANKEKTLEGIRKSKRNLATTKEEHDAFREKWGDLLYPISQRLGNGDMYHGENIMSDILEHKDYAGYYKREYGKELTQQEIDTIDTFIKQVRNSFPTGYFETKFERPVYLNEFEVAVIPEGTSPDVVEVLKNAGLDIRTYDTSDYDTKEDKRRQATMDAVTKRSDILFQMEHPVMAGEKPVRSLMTEGNLFTDADFMPEVKASKKEKDITKLSDKQLLNAISKSEAGQRRKYIDEYDRRHDEEHDELMNSYSDMLMDTNTSIEDAYQMYDNVFRQFKDGGYATQDRTKLMAQIDAIEGYVAYKEEEMLNTQMEEEAEAEATGQQNEQKQQFEQQKREAERIGYDLTQLRLRELEEDETCHVERRYVENGTFTFTGKEKIESVDDVAYIFKQLENAAIENSFLVLEKDSVPTIIHLGVGNYTNTVAEVQPALAAYNELKPDKVYFIHNHPSGSLKGSKPDKDVMQMMRAIFGRKLQDGIIIDTTSGKYGIFNEGSKHANEKNMPKSVQGELPVRVFSFSKQVFDEGWNPDTAFAGDSSYKIAQFISSHRLGMHKKMSLIVMNQNWNITGNVFLPYTSLGQAARIEGADLIARYMNQMGGTMVAIYGNYDYDDAIDRQDIDYLRTLLRARRVPLRDVIHIDHSAYDMGLVSEEMIAREDMFAGEPVTDKSELERLESEPKIKVYRSMQLRDGKLYPPMSGKVDGEWRKPTELGKWERSEEHPELADENGKFLLDKGNKKSLKANYNPYFHSTNFPLNDQFAEAQDRPELVTVEVEIPESELTSGYKAEKAHDSVGEIEWKAGVVQAGMTGKRKVILSRWDKPIRIVPDEEIASLVAPKLLEAGVTMPTNVVTPSLRKALEAEGVPFIKTNNKGKIVAGEYAGKTWSQWRKATKDTAKTVKIGNIEDKYSDDVTIDDSIKMDEDVRKMSPSELIRQYKRLNSEMLDENGLDIDQQEDAFRKEWFSKHGIEGFGQASADHLTKQANRYTYKKMALRWDILDRIEKLGLKDYINSDSLPEDEMPAKIIKMQYDLMRSKGKNVRAYNVGTDIEYTDDHGNAQTIRIHTPLDVVNSLPAEKIEPHNLSKEELRKIYYSFEPATNSHTGETVRFYHDAFKKNHREGGSFEKVAPYVRDLFKTSVLAFSDEENLSGAVRKDGSVHKKHPDVINFGHYLNRVTMDGKTYYVRFTVQRHKNEGGVHSTMVTNVDVYENPAIAASDPQHVWRSVDYDRISDAKLRIYLEKSKEFAKKIASSYKKMLSEIRNQIIEESEREVAKVGRSLGGVKVKFIKHSDADARMREEIEAGTKGLYNPNTGEVILFPENIGSVEEAIRTVFHEKLGHEGLVALLGSQAEVNKFGQFVYETASKALRKRIVAKADEEGYDWTDPLRFSKAAQEVIAGIAENGPRSADEFSLWRKIKYYLIRLCNKLGLRIRGLLNDHDLAYYILKTGEALKKWNDMPDPTKRAFARQNTDFDNMYSRRGKPRKRNDESMAQYLERLRNWEKWKIAEEQAAANNDPMPEADKINEKWENQYRADLDAWKAANGIDAEDGATGPGAFPRRSQGETPQQYAARVADYETRADAWRGAPSFFDYMQRANDEYKNAYSEWKMRYGVAEAESVDLHLYEGSDSPEIVDPADLEADMRAEADFAEAAGVDVSSEGARRHAKIAIIERRKNLESANAEDAIWIHNITKSINYEAERQGVAPKTLREAMADIIEGTYFKDILRDEHGNVVAVVDISDQMPIKMTTGLKDILDTIKDWYDEFYHVIEDAGLRNNAGYIAEGYVNHIWSKEKSDPEAWEKYVENFQRIKSPNMRERKISTYREGEDIGLVRKYNDISDILAYYSSSNNQAVANRKMLDALSFIVVEELNGDGEVVSALPLLNSSKPNIMIADRYKMYQVPGVGDVWVVKDIQRQFANVFGTMRTQDIPEWLTKTGRVYDVAASTAKKIELAFSAFHMGALTEVAIAQMRPDRAMRALAQYIIFDCVKAGTIPAYAHPEDFKFAASHLVQLGATQDYSSADVNNVTEKFREIIREAAESEKLPVKVSGYINTPLAAALDYINKGFDKVLWNYLHDGLKIACFKMFAEQIEKRVEKEGLTPEKREELLDEAGQYVNDTFGGQYFELLNISPALIKWLRRAFLSPDWLISTQRHFLANAGFGSLYSESGFLNYLRYNRDNIKRAFGADIPRDENRRFRSKNAKQCYLLGVCAFFYVMMNAINTLFRAQDEEKEKEKAEEERRTNPEYLSPYELAYPDGMKWYDYTMYGNTIGQQTHLFLGRYNDGTEWYARWGKQFREFPELFMGRHGVEFPTPLMERMSGKANPIGRYLMYDLPLTIGMYGYRQPRETQEIAEKYGNTVALLAMTAKKFLPFSVPTQEDKEFKMFDLVMPSQKGFTKWKAVDFFKTYIQAGDMDGIQRTYNAVAMNGIDAEDCLKAAIATVKATQRKELSDGITSLQDAMDRFDAAKDAKEKKYFKSKITKYLAEQNYKIFTRDEAMEQVNSFLNGDQPTDNEINKYVELSTSSDVRDDYRLSMIRKQAKKFVDEVKTSEGERQKKLRSNYDAWFKVDAIIKEATRDMNKIKKQLGKQPADVDGEKRDDRWRMKKIREIRSGAQKRIDEIQAP